MNPLRWTALLLAAATVTACTPVVPSATGPSGASTSSRASSPASKNPPTTESPGRAAPGTALATLATLTVKGRAPKTGFSRAQFGPTWLDIDHNGCDTRNDVLRRDLTNEKFKAGTRDCVIVSGTLADPYTGTSVTFLKGGAVDVDIDHVVALSDGWQTGAFGWPVGKRTAMANDPLNLLAVKASANRQKGDADAATWLPANTRFRCTYVARQIAVKAKYGLWVIPAEQQAMSRVLATCPAQKLPT